jgi:hypothetical protein
MVGVGITTLVTPDTRMRSNVFGIHVDRLQASKNKYYPKNLINTVENGFNFAYNIAPTGCFFRSKMIALTHTTQALHEGFQ